MLKLISYQSSYLPTLRELWTEHLQSARDLAQTEYSVTIDVPNTSQQIASIRSGAWALLACAASLR